MAAIQAGHLAQVEAYVQCVKEGREETHGVLVGGDWNEPMGDIPPVVRSMAEAGLRLIAHGHLDGLFASGAFRCVSVEVLHPERPADHPWLFVTVDFDGHTFTVLLANTHVGLAIPQLRQEKRRLRPDLVLTCENQRPLARKALARAFPPWTWARSGFVPAATDPGSAGTQILARRSVFHKGSEGNLLISEYLDRNHPTRRLTYADLRHRKAKLTFRAISAHTWTLHE